MANDWISSISADSLTLFLSSDRPSEYGGFDIWVTTRATVLDPWEPAENLGPIVNSASDEASASISADGLTLYFDDYGGPRPGTVGGVDIWVTTRPTVSDSWGTPVNLGWPGNSSGTDGGPSISADGLTCKSSRFNQRT